MPDQILDTFRFRLRPLTEADATERYASWLRGEATQRFIVTAQATSGLDELKSYVRERSGRDDVVFFGIFLRSSGLHIGNVKFEPVDAQSGYAVMGILIGDPDWRGKGVAVEVLDACGEWLHRHRGVSTMVLGVDHDNDAGIRAYLKAGFVIENLEGFEIDPEKGLSMVRRHRASTSSKQRFALGTAQFGLSYGVANASGRVESAEAAAIVELARNAGVDTLDTAVAYGEAEQVLGGFDTRGWRVVSKLPFMPEDCPDIGAWVRSNVSGSLRRLRLSRLRAVLLHRPQQLLAAGGDELYRALDDLKAQGLVEKIGVSIYSPAELTPLWPRFAIDMVQTPYSIVDRRLKTSGWLDKLEEAGIEVHVRSIFLQGLLLQNAASRPAYFDRWSALWTCWHDWLRTTAASPLEACVRYALAERGISRVVIGVDSKRHLEQILAASGASGGAPPEALSCEDENLVNPSLWPAFNRGTATAMGGC